MPQVEKASLRAEFDALKGRFERLCADGQLGAEGRALVELLVCGVEPASEFLDDLKGT